MMSQRLLLGRLRKLLPCRRRRCDGGAVRGSRDCDSATEFLSDSWLTETPGSTDCQPLPRRSRRRRQRAVSVINVEESDHCATKCSTQEENDYAATRLLLLPATHSTQSARTLDDDASMSSCAAGFAGCQATDASTAGRPAAIVPSLKSSREADSLKLSGCGGAAALADGCSQRDAATGATKATARGSATSSSCRASVRAAAVDCDGEQRTLSGSAATPTESPQRDSVSRSRQQTKKFLADCQAEVCQLLTRSSRATAASVKSYVLSASDDLVISEHLVKDHLVQDSAEHVDKMVNNALLNYQRSLNAELCEVDCHQSGSTEMNLSGELIQLSTNLSNVALPNHSSLAASDHAVCHQPLPPALMVQSEAALTQVSERSELKAVTDASVACSAACVKSTEAAAAGPAVSDVAEESLPAAAMGCNGDDFGPGQGDGLVDECQRTAKAVPEELSRDKLGSANDIGMILRSRISGVHSASTGGRRHGALSNSRCANLCDALSSNVLMDRYLSKRDVPEATRVWHRQRCAYISADLVQKVLQKSADTSVAAATAAAAAAAAATEASAAAGRANFNPNNSAVPGFDCCHPVRRPPLRGAAGANSRSKPMARMTLNLASIVEKM